MALAPRSPSSSSHRYKSIFWLLRAFLKKGILEGAQNIADHADSRTTTFMIDARRACSARMSSGYGWKCGRMATRPCVPIDLDKHRSFGRNLRSSAQLEITAGVLTPLRKNAITTWGDARSMKQPSLDCPDRFARLDRCEEDHYRKNQKLFSKNSARTVGHQRITEMAMKANQIQSHGDMEVLKLIAASNGSLGPRRAGQSRSAMFD